MNVSEPANAGRLSWLVPAILALLVGATILLASSMSITWLMLIVLALGAVAAFFWSKDPRSFLLAGYAFTSTLFITKGLVAEGGVATPGLFVSLSDFFLAGLLVAWIVERALTRTRLAHWTPLHWLALAYVVWTWLTGLGSVGGFFGALFYTRHFLVFLLLSEMIRSPQDLRRVLFALALGLSLHLVFAAAQMASGGQLEIQGYKASEAVNLTFENAGGLRSFRPSGLLAHPNGLGAYLVYVLPLLALFWLLGPGRLGKARWWVVSALLAGSFAALVATLSRAAWIAFLVALAFALVMACRKKILKARHVARLGAAGIATAGLALLAYPAALLRITEPDQRSTEARVVMIRQALSVIQEHPLAGVGIAGYRDAARKHSVHTETESQSDFQKQIARASVVHNRYLLTAAEQGLIGLALFLLLLWRFFRLFFKVERWPDPVFLAAGLGITAALLGQYVLYAFDHYYNDIIPPGLLWIFFGLQLAISNLVAERAP